MYCLTLILIVVTFAPTGRKREQARLTGTHLRYLRIFDTILTHRGFKILSGHKDSIPERHIVLSVNNLHSFLFWGKPKMRPFPAFYRYF